MPAAFYYAVPSSISICNAFSTFLAHRLECFIGFFGLQLVNFLRLQPQRFVDNMWVVAVLICRFGVCEAPFPLGGKQRSRTFFSCSLTTVDQVCGLQDQSSWMTILSVEDWSCTLISGGLGVVWEDVKTVFLPTTVENCCCSNSQNPTGDLYQLLCEPLCYILKSQMAGYWTFLLYLLRSPTKIQRLLCIENLKILSRSGRYCRNSSIIPGTAAVRYSE